MDERQLVPASSDHGEICKGARVANANFKVFVPLVSEEEASGGMCLTVENITNEITWRVSELYGLNCGWDCQEGSKVRTRVVGKQGKAWSIRAGQELISNSPASVSKGVRIGEFALDPDGKQKGAENEREKEKCEPVSHVTMLARCWPLARYFRTVRV